jgi:hypothetical protein
MGIVDGGMATTGPEKWYDMDVMDAVDTVDSEITAI